MKTLIALLALVTFIVMAETEPPPCLIELRGESQLTSEPYIEDGLIKSRIRTFMPYGPSKMHNCNLKNGSVIRGHTAEEWAEYGAVEPLFGTNSESLSYTVDTLAHMSIIATALHAQKKELLGSARYYRNSQENELKAQAFERAAADIDAALVWLEAEVGIEK